MTMIDIESIKIAPLRKGDILICKVKGRLTDETADKIKQGLQWAVGEGGKVLVVSDEVELEVVRPEDIQPLTLAEPDPPVGRLMKNMHG